MKIGALKAGLWFLVIISLALSFPQQVYFNSPLPALLPYFGVGSIMALDLAAASMNGPGIAGWNIRRPIEFLVTVYIGLVLFQTGWQLLFGLVSIYQGASAIVIFVFPAIFFVYFRNGLSERESRLILLSIALAGLIVAGYFAYDSICKLVLHKLPSYNLYVHQYEFGRLGSAIGENSGRTSATSRSMGLLEKHSVSAAWISIGCFAALSLIPFRAILKRIGIVLAYGVPLALGMNFTGIAGFLLILFLFEFKGYSLARGVIDRRALLKLLCSLGVFIASILAVALVFSGELTEAVKKVITAQLEVISGTHVSRVSGQGYFADMFSALMSLPAILAKFPPAVILGDGFTTGFGVLAKGGDYGFIDTLCRLGVPLFIVVFTGLIRLIRRSVQQIRSLAGTGDVNNANYLRFAASVMSYVLFAEVHYSVWSYKSVLPVIFLCLAIFSGYARTPPPRKRPPAADE